MSINEAPSTRTLVKRMEWLAHRQKVMANNIAHADNPKFKPSDMDKFDPISAMKSAKMGVLGLTNPKHMQGRGQQAIEGSHKVKLRTQGSDRDLGNGVILEEELAKVAETQHQYAEMLNLYRRHYGMLRMAIGRSQ